MTKASHQQLITDFFAKFTACDVDGLLSILDEQVIWQMMGQQGGLPVSGQMNKSEIADFTLGAKSLFSGTLKMFPSAWTIDGDRVAVEVESKASLDNGRTYNNLYHYLFVITNGYITTVKEYADTDQVRRVILD